MEENELVLWRLKRQESLCSITELQGCKSVTRAKYCHFVLFSTHLTLKCNRFKFK